MSIISLCWETHWGYQYSWYLKSPLAFQHYLLLKKINAYPTFATLFSVKQNITYHYLPSWTHIATSSERNKCLWQCHRAPIRPAVLRKALNYPISQVIHHVMIMYTRIESFYDCLKQNCPYFPIGDLTHAQNDFSKSS